MSDDSEGFESAIAALPAPAGEEVTVEDLAKYLCVVIAAEPFDEVSAAKYTRDASRLLYDFTILAKSEAQEGQGS